MTDSSFIDVFAWTARADDAGIRLDHFLRDQETGHTRSHLKKLIDSGHVRVDGQEARPAQKLRIGQEVVLTVPPPEPLTLEPEEMALDIHFEDDAVIVVNKPQGVVVHPAIGHPSGTLINGILFGRTAAGGDPLRPGIVHRLDKDTTGLLVVAKAVDVHAALAQQFHDHTVDRCYRALVSGNPPSSGQWQTLYGRHPKDRKRFSSKVTRGKVAKSRFERLEQFNGAALLKVTLETGRTHQVRVHCADHGYPVLGDPQYGPRRLASALAEIHGSLPGQALHAARLGFDHPRTGERLRFEVDPPRIFMEALENLRRGPG